jgi:hypothetical protein
MEENKGVAGAEKRKREKEADHSTVRNVCTSNISQGVCNPSNTRRKI